MTKREVERLPKWAQLEIETLRHRIGLLESQTGQNAKSNTTHGIEALDTHGDLPHGESVQFHANRKKGRYVEARMLKGRLNLVASGSISVRRLTCNCVQIRLAPSQ